MPSPAHFEEIADPAVLEPRWRAVEVAADDPSFFLRWTWIGSWLATLHAHDIPLPRLLVIGRDEGLALIGTGSAQCLLGRVPSLWLNQCGVPEGDRPFIEYNGLLCRDGDAVACVHGFCEAMAAERDWRRLYLSGLTFGSPLIDVPAVRRRTIRDASPACFVDLAKVREEGDYLALLSANTRAQIKRSMKDEPGEPELIAATDLATVDDWLSDMHRMNAGHHQDNAWDSAFFRDFARALAHAGLANGSVELLRVARGEETLGYLMNLVWAGRAMNYQSAFAPPRTPRSKPGLMCHAAAVDRYSTAGLSHYSLLAGKDRYKQSLSTDAEMIEWWVLERADWRLEAEALLRRLFRRPSRAG
ncbi:MAG: GNAT family N-acetyltransferase [Sphingobium sp.]